MTLTPGTLRRILNLWPPFLFAGIHVHELAPDWRSAHVELRMRPWNRNYVGVHFGGNLFAMTDPFWMILVKESLGREYLVWDQSATIDFVKPGRGTVRARFQLDDHALAEMRAATADGAKHLRWFETEVVDAAGDVIARVRKQVYVRRKRARLPGPVGGSGTWMPTPETVFRRATATACDLERGSRAPLPPLAGEGRDGGSNRVEGSLPDPRPRAEGQ